MKKFWFKSKTYGWGWAPATWEAWTILAIYIAICAGLAWHLDLFTAGEPTVDEVIPFVIEMMLLTVLLIVICWKTGEKPRWRWGKDT